MDRPEYFKAIVIGCKLQLIASFNLLVRSSCWLLFEMSLRVECLVSFSVITESIEFVMEVGEPSSMATVSKESEIVEEDLAPADIL